MMHILNKDFDVNIALSASFVAAVDNSIGYEPTAVSLFCNFFIIHRSAIKNKTPNCCP